MNRAQKLERRKLPKRFYFLTLLIYVPIIYCLAVIGARWYGFVIATLSFAGLMWIRRSKAWQGFYVPLCFALAFITAFCGLYFGRPRWDVSLPGQIGSGTMRVVLHLPVDESIKSGKTFEELSVWKAPDGYSHTSVQLPNCTMEVFESEQQQSGWAVLQLHGGAFVSGMNDLYRELANRYCNLGGGATVYTLDYRLAPDYPYPAQQQDAMDAWNYITNTLGYPANRVLVAGDSAGGNLVLSLTLRLRDAGRELPAGLIGMSPWADLSNSGSSHITNATKDPTFGIDEKSFDGVTPVGVDSTYTVGLNDKDPDISPSFGDYHGFPPMLLQAGELEVLLSDSEMVYENAVANGVDCTLTVYPGMFHVFEGSLDLLPESKAAWEEIGAFITRITGVSPIAAP